MGPIRSNDSFFPFAGWSLVVPLVSDRYKRDEFRANSKDEIRPEAALISFVPRSQYCDERRTLIFAVRSRHGNVDDGEKISVEIRWMVMSPAFRGDASNSTDFQSYSRIFFVRPPSAVPLSPNGIALQFREAPSLIPWPSEQYLN